MDKHLKWLWLALTVSSAGWLISEWIDFTQQISSGNFDLQQATNQQNLANSISANGSAETPSIIAEPASDIPNIKPASSAAPIPIDPNSTQVVRFETNNYLGLISLRGANLIELKLKNYPISVDQPDLPVTLLNAGNNAFSLQSGLISEQSAPNHHQLYSSQKQTYQVDSGALIIPLSWQQNGIKVTKTYRFNADSHAFSLETQVDNQTDQTWTGNAYTQISRALPDDDSTSAFINTYTGAAWWTKESGFEKIDFEELATSTPDLEDQRGWLAMLQHYFIVSLIADDGSNYFYTKKSGNQYIIGSASEPLTAQANSSAKFSIDAFLGPKRQDELLQAHAQLDYAVDYGVFHVISAPLFWILDHIHDLVGNWGVAIILITLLIKLAFYKLSEKSYRSMARLKLLTPRIQQLRERYGDDKAAMNQKMMQIYKQEKVNPLGGCLPILVQIPVFISLYWVLIESVEIRQAPFVLWVQDLSIADPYFVLPLLMGLSMFLQQRLNPPPADPMQAKVMQFLPAIFTVFFLFFPAGLVLYWVVNNVLSIAQQWYITRNLQETQK